MQACDVARVISIHAEGSISGCWYVREMLELEERLDTIIRCDGEAVAEFRTSAYYNIE